MRLVFDTFDQNARNECEGTLRYLVEQNIVAGPSPFRSESRESRMALADGQRRRQHDPQSSAVRRQSYSLKSVKSILGRKNPEKRGSGRVVMEPKDYHALIPDHCPAYITMERYESGKLQRRLAEKPCPCRVEGISTREGSRRCWAG